jgi:maltooligosyltrehalose synthase
MWCTEQALIMGTALASELNVLAHSLNRISEGNRKSRDFTLDSLRDVRTEFVACFPVYRTYVDARGWSAADRAVVARAISRATRNLRWSRRCLISSGRSFSPRLQRGRTAFRPERRSGIRRSTKKKPGNACDSR